jgi:4-amino-4-deoxy-L-arabinose transferase-like glycosyltransferase
VGQTGKQVQTWSGGEGHREDDVRTIAERWTRRSSGRFGLTVLVLTIVGIAARLAYVAVFVDRTKLGLDSTAYLLMVGPLQHGHGYSDGALAFFGKYVPTANFPPLYVVFLTLMRNLGFTTITQARAVSSVAGAGTIPLVAVLGRRLIDARTGVVAAALAALWPFLLSTDGSLMSETLAVPLVSAAILATVWAFDGRRILRWALAGTLFALAALTRAEAPVLMVFVVGMALVAQPAVKVRARVAAAGVTALAFMLVSAPWVIYVARDFGVSNLWATDSAKVVAGANCGRTYYGSDIGLWDVRCVVPTHVPQVTEADSASTNRSRATHYAWGHFIRAPLVAVVRVLRVGGLFNPGQQREFETVESRNRGWQLFAWWCYVLLLPASFYGFVVILRRSRAARALLGAFAGIVVVSAVSYGNQRTRMVVEPIVLLCAAAGLTTFWNRHARRSQLRPAEPQPQASRAGKVGGAE